MKRLPLESSQLSLVTSRVFGDHDVYIRSALGRGAPPPNPNLTVRVRPSPVRLQTQSTFRWAHADTGCAAYHPYALSEQGFTCCVSAAARYHTFTVAHRENVFPLYPGRLNL
eukprot:2083094-Pyramimonas_sp.AAC.1